MKPRSDPAVMAAYEVIRQAMIDKNSFAQGRKQMAVRDLRKAVDRQEKAGAREQAEARGAYFFKLCGLFLFWGI